jgi:hypothetical protein
VNLASAGSRALVGMIEKRQQENDLFGAVSEGTAKKSVQKGQQT